MDLGIIFWSSPIRLCKLFADYIETCLVVLSNMSYKQFYLQHTGLPTDIQSNGYALQCTITVLVVAIMYYIKLLESC